MHPSMTKFRTADPNPDTPMNYINRMWLMATACACFLPLAASALTITFAYADANGKAVNVSAVLTASANSIKVSEVTVNANDTHSLDFTGSTGWIFHFLTGSTLYFNADGIDAGRVQQILGPSLFGTIPSGSPAPTVPDGGETVLLLGLGLIGLVVVGRFIHSRRHRP